jgi:endonuclease III-like uncharacterized protein
MATEREQLLAITGIGEATADKILDITACDHSADEELESLVCDAWDYYVDQQHGYAGKYLRQAHERVHDK